LSAGIAGKFEVTLTFPSMIAIISGMSRRFRHVLKNGLATLLAMVVLLPLGGRSCPHCAAAVVGLVGAAEQAAGCPHCQRSSSSCNDTQGPSSCCAKNSGSHSSGSPSLCSCGEVSPADKPAAAPKIDLNAAHFYAVAASSCVFPENDSHGTAPEVAAFAPNVPHRILHCSWLV